MTDEIYGTITEYLRPLVKDIESIKILSQEDWAESEDSEYPHNVRYINEDYLTIRSAEGYDSIDLSPLYEDLPSSLENQLCHTVYKDSTENDLVVSLSISPDRMDVSENSVDISNPSVEGFSRILRTIKSDMEFMNSTESEELLKIIKSDENSGLIEVHTDLIPDLTTFGLTDYTNIDMYMWESNMICTQILGREGDYYKFEVKPSDKESIQTIRDDMIFEGIQRQKLKCDECRNSSVTVGTISHIPHCTNCGHNFFQLQPNNVSLYKTITEFTQETWKEYVPDKRLNQNIQKIDLSDADLLYDDPLIYLEKFGNWGNERTLLYVDIGAENLLIPFEPKSGEINVNTTIEGDEKICYNCGDQLGDGIHAEIARLGILQGDDMCTDLANFCQTCIDNYESKFEDILEENPDIRSNIVAKTV